jgi:hypothetical protein
MLKLVIQKEINRIQIAQAAVIIKNMKAYKFNNDPLLLHKNLSYIKEGFFKKEIYP